MDRGETKQSLVSPLLLSIENLTNFETEVSAQKSSNFPHVISVEETENVDYSFVLKEDNFVAGDIVLWDGEKKVVADPKGFSLPTSGYTPIGVVVIPASHMDDGHARMISTRWMSCENPENGSAARSVMLWGSDTELTGLTNYTQVPVIARYDDEDQGGVTALTEPQSIYTVRSEAFTSSDYPSWTGEINSEDKGTRWYQSNTYHQESNGRKYVINNFYAPSPYASDGTPNPLYRATSYSGGSLNNALSYFDGRHQTDVILEARGEKDYESWKPDADTPEDFPAASCCDMYHTVGTKQGDWYLPSQAELGYVVARLNCIISSMSKIDGLEELTHKENWIWSSTERALELACPINIQNGRIASGSVKFRDYAFVVPFTTV